MKPIDIIAGIISIALLILLTAVAVANAQTRYDHDQQWIRKTIRDQRRAEEREERQKEAWLERWTPERGRRAEWRERHQHNHERYYGRQEPNYEARVYGYIARTNAATRRWDATGSVECYPSVEAYSVEANTEDGAWSDSQRNWENQVRAMYGERWLEVKNARDIEKQCWASSGNQSTVGRIAERVGAAVQNVTGNEGGLDGRKHRCRILARPCQAPKEIEPATKGDKR